MFSNSFDGHKYHPENEFEGEPFTEGEKFAIQEVSDALQLKYRGNIGVRYNAQAGKDCIFVKFKLYQQNGKKKDVFKIAEAIMNRANWEWTTADKTLKFNKLFKYTPELRLERENT